MATYEPRIRKQETGFYALVVRIDHDGEESVVPGFGKTYQSEKMAQRGAKTFMRRMFV